MAKHNVIDKFESLKKAFWHHQSSPETEEAMTACIREAVEFLKPLKQVDLTSKVPGKKFFQFRDKEDSVNPSRAVNAFLFPANSLNEIVKEWTDLVAKVRRNPTKIGLDPIDINQRLYRAVMSFCCAADGISKRDQQRPGTFFAYMVGFLFSLVSGTEPAKQVQVLQLLEENQKGTLPTDFIFDMGKGKCKFHVPVKTSTRERIVQIFAHHAILNRTYGNRSFLATAFVIGETKTSKETGEVTEICIANQIQVFQERLEVIDRFYYLDPPEPYLKLNQHHTIRVRLFGDFFAEFKDLAHL